MVLYADTSALCSYYAPDANTPAAGVVIRGAAAALHRLELRNALSRMVFNARMTRADADTALRSVARDLRAGLLKSVTPPWQLMLRNASALSLKHTPMTGCRSFDALHVALAQHLGVADFLSFDHKQRTFARVAGLRVVP